MHGVAFFLTRYWSYISSAMVAISQSNDAYLQAAVSLFGSHLIIRIDTDLEVEAVCMSGYWS
jgi:hypothetical protein